MKAIHNSATANGTTLLQWTTLAEQSNSGFEVQRSTDNATWNDLAFINSKAPNGNSSVALSYTFTDNIPVIGTDYYRLKETDCDGSVMYSAVVSATFSKLPLVLYPNPTSSSKATLSGLVGNEEIRITDAAGRTISTQKATGHSTQLNLYNMALGVYFVLVKTAAGVVLTVKGEKGN